MKKTPVYLDYNATSPVDPKVAAAMEPYMRQFFGNPSSSHSYGIKARQAIEEARLQVAEMIHCETEEIIFTSGGSESNNLALKGIAEAHQDKGRHIIISAVEHPSVSEVGLYLEQKGFRISILPVDDGGFLHPDTLRDIIDDETILVSVMHANNEVGTLQAIPELARIAHERGALLHTDAAQSIGKIPVHVDELHCDLLTIAGHKFYGPKGVGALFVKRGVKLEKLIHGANHERDRRAGTENVIEIVGLGAAARLVREEKGQAIAHLAALRDPLESGLLEAFPLARINGIEKERLPNTTSISFPGLEANTIIDAMTGVMASAGAACHTETVDVSAVLEAMFVPLEYAMGTIRFSVGRFTTSQEIKQALAEIIRVIRSLQSDREVTDLADGETIKLTQFTHGLGCACKLRPQLLEKVLDQLPVPDDGNILIGTESSDDAAVYRISDEMAMVQTVDFFTPIVDDAYHFGAIAAANSLSDIYAMGARPLFALNVVGFPSNRLPMNVLEQILKGASDKALEAGISIIGGHTVDDTEPKFGLSVSGMIHPDHIIRNRGARADDVLILTKKLGTGIMATALKRGVLTPDQKQELISTMERLNRNAAEIMLQFDVHACTDITGFGLLGHLLEMVKSSKVTVEIESSNIPVLEGVKRIIDMDIIPGGTKDNAAFTSGHITYPSDFPEWKKWLLNDAQTSGGLLISLPESEAQSYVDRMYETGETVSIIAGINPQGERPIIIRD